MRRAAMAWAFLPCLWASTGVQAQLWWERGADTWYYKDDWKGSAVSCSSRGGGPARVAKTIEVPEGAAWGWIVVWGERGYRYYPGYQCTHERTHVDPWLEAVLFGIRHGVPIHCGEFGLSMIQPAGDGEAWLDDYLAFFERFEIGRNWWNYSGGDIYRTGLAAGDRISPYVPILRKWMDGSGWRAARRAAPSPSVKQ